MAFYPSERLIELIEKSDNGELTKEEKEELLLRCELETPSKSQSNISSFGLGFLIGSLFKWLLNEFLFNYPVKNEKLNR